MVLERNPARAAQGKRPISGRRKERQVDQLTARQADQSTGATPDGGRDRYMQYLPFDMLPRSRRQGLQADGTGGIHQFQATFRLNHAFPPFDNPAVRSDVEAGRPGRDP